MVGILSIATSGLNAFLKALDVTANNLANGHTDGYSRQTIVFASTASQRFAGSFIGTGVTVSQIKRNNDEFATRQVRDTLTIKSQYEAFYQQASQIDKLLSQDGTSVSATLQNFFNALSELNTNPDNAAARGVALKQSELLVDQFNTMQMRLDEYQRNNSAQLSATVTEINGLSKNIAEINLQIASGSNAPELLDQRDELLRQLSEYTEVTVIPQDDSTINVSIGNGQMLVIGAEHRDLAVNVTKTGQFGTQIVLGNGAGQIDVTNGLHSGMIGGLLDYEQGVLAHTSQLLGQMAMGLAETFNAQHKLGMDMNSEIGKDFFTDFNQLSLQLARSVPTSSNAGTGVMSVQISDMNAVKLSDYELIVSDTGSNEIRLLRKSDGQSTVLNWSNSPPAPPAGAVTIDGMTITVDDVGNLVDDDRFMLMPTRGAARELNLQISDPREIAFASPVRTQSSLSNTGTGAIQLGDVFNTTMVNKDYRIDFISPTQYNLVNVTDSITTGPLTYTPNSNNTLMIPDSITPSYSVVISGIPNTGDQFTASFNSGGTADSGNGLKLGAIQKNKMFEGGTENLFDRYSSLIASVGSSTYQAKLRNDAADILHNQAVDFRHSKSAVDYDTEAANLIRFKEAYGAAGQLLTIANEIINVLFTVLR